MKITELGNGPSECQCDGKCEYNYNCFGKRIDADGADQNGSLLP